VAFKSEEDQIVNAKAVGKYLTGEFELGERWTGGVVVSWLEPRDGLGHERESEANVGDCHGGRLCWKYTQRVS